MAEFTSDWFSYNIAQWGRLITQLRWSQARPLTVIEIGSYEGRASLWILDNLMVHPDSRLHCIDTFEGSEEHTEEQRTGLFERFTRNIESNPNRDKVVVHRSLSRIALLKLLGEGLVADFVYVDGSHVAPDVLEDLVLSFRLLRVGGLMICDDYLWFNSDISQRDLVDSPKLAIDAFVNIFIRKLTLFRKQELYQLAFVKISD
ncbi:MAG: class I SAM-dependent methyltransferase [Proteobacteria bacterium]|nr:class I SAM-dependent methyltransferase [Pseudomonadota bacterium]